MPKGRGFLMLYSLLITALATLTILAVALRPPEGWGPLLREQWQQVADWLAPEPEPEPMPPAQAAPQTAPTPNEPTYRIQAVYDAGTNVVRGQATVILPEQRLDEIPFYLYSSPEHPMKVTDVKRNGGEAGFTLTAKELILHVGKDPRPQTVTFAFETRLPETRKRSGVWAGVATVSYWYPILAVERDGHWVPRPEYLGFGDPYLMDPGTYEIEWNSPAGIKWFGSGEKTGERTVEGGRVVSTWRAEKVRNFALVGGANFQARTFESGYGTTVHVATVSGEMLARTEELARSAVQVYSEVIGRNPYPVLNVLELPAGTVYAHELPNMALFSHDLWTYEDPEHWITHEIGHAWFYNAVGNYEPETPWLDEGLADYLALLETERRLGAGEYVKRVRAAWERFAHNYTYTPYRNGTPAGVTNGQTAVPYGSYATSQAHYYYNYLRPVLMYHDIRKVLGEERFLKFLRQYYIKNIERTATRGDLEQALRDVSPEAVDLMKIWLDMPNQQLIQTVSARFGG